jgi:acetate---CoA ligase (ADP-forming)
MPRAAGPSRPDIASFLAPKSIAVVGASSNPRRLGGRLLANLRRRGFPGAVYPINPGHDEIQGLTAYATVADLPEAPDLALVIVRGELVLGVLEECAAAGVKGAIIFASGFAEAGSGGHDENAIRDLAARTGLVVSGPNGEGYFNAVDRVGATFSPTITYDDEADVAARRSVSVVAQSGGAGFSIFNRGFAKGLGFRHVVSTGNEACLDSLDVAEYLIEDSETAVLTLFIEGFKDGRRLAPLAARAADLGKPLVIAKVGQSESGRRAAVSHTASIAGSNAAYGAIAWHYGILGGEDADEIADIAGAFATCPPAAGPRVAVVTTSGGNGVWLADTVERLGLQVPELSAPVQAEIDTILPYFGATANPIDVTAATAHDGGVFRVLDILERSDEVDMIAVAGPLASAEFVADAADDLARIARDSRKPVLYFAYSLPSLDNIRRLAAIGIYCYTTLRGIGSALKALADYGAFQARWQERRRDAAAAAADGPPPPVPVSGGTVSEHAVLAWLAAHGVTTAPGHLAATAEEAIAAARRLAVPVALKGQSSDLPHKSDAGAVVLGVAGAEAVASAHEEVVEACRRAGVTTSLEGVLVQAMSPPGHEMLAGILRDPDFGPLVLVGRGGVDAEAMPDTVLAPAPLTTVDAREMIGRLTCAPLLAGTRGRPAADIDALAGLLVTLSGLAIAWPDGIAEMDLNPVIVHAPGSGLTVVDALIVA